MNKPLLRTIVLTITLVGVSAVLLRAQGTRLLRDPDIGPSHIVFAHANDLWLTSRDGGEAFRLTSDIGNERGPSFSPDGNWIAFTAQYSGNTDVYIVSARGGEPRRLTWHPGADVAQGWTPNGEVMFQSGREGQPTRLWKFFTVSTTGGLPKPLAVPQAYQGEMSSDGKWLAYQEIQLWDPEWRNYRGGQAQAISVVSTDTWDHKTPAWEGERQLAPVWMNGVVYYLSERDWASNVWSYDPRSGRDRQLTHHADFDVKSLGAGDGVIVYEQAGYLHELNPRNGRSRQLEISIARDLNWARSRWEEISSSSLRDARLSPTGKRALFESRGDLFTVPVEEGSWRNITRTSGVADRHAVWSPDGEKIAWFNDDGEEYGLVIADQDGTHQRRIEIPDPTFFFAPEWSPDGQRLAFADTDYRLLVLDLESENLTHVDTDRYAHPQRTLNPAWSSDSRWLAYSRRLENHLHVIMLFDTETGQTHRLTDGMADSISPVWDVSGKYLYFLASTNYALNTGWLDMTSYDRPVTRALYVALLQQDEPSPFLPLSDEEKAPEEKTGKEESQSPESEEQALAIDFDGISRRIVDAPGLPLRDYSGLAKGPKGQVFVLENVPNQQGSTVHRYSLEDRKPTQFLERASAIAISHDRKKLLYRSGSNWQVADADGAVSREGDKRLNVGGMRVHVDPRAEWQQMLRDGWRFMRDFLYVDNVHGAPWDDIWEWYSPWLEDVNHRTDFNYLLDIVSGEVAVGHSYVSGGDNPDLTNPRTGLLGADLEEANGRYRIKRIYNGEDWTPGLSGPLSVPGLGVHEGDYLLAIDGRELAIPTNPFQLLEGTANRTINITVNSQPSMDGARTVAVVPLARENQLRSWAWVEGNRRRVDELSDGRLAYVWLPNTGQGGYAYFNRMYFAQQDKQGAVIDERNNGGGSAADYIVDILARELTGYFNSRAGDKRPFTQPIAGLFGPKVMIINERAGSGGDLLPYLFSFRKVGPLIGTRTWGGLVGTWDTPPLIDGGRMVAPRGGFFDVNGEWAVEADGVPPDIEVRNHPRPVIEGGDPQLERAVAEALKRLETERVILKPEPAPPIRSKRPGGRQ